MNGLERLRRDRFNGDRMTQADELITENNMAISLNFDNKEEINR